MCPQQTKPYIYPRWIEKDGERYEFAESRPGWLVYENERHFILVGREEAKRLAVDPNANYEETS